MINLEDSLDSNLSEEVLCTGSTTQQEQEFDTIVGHLETILMDDSFTSMQTSFCTSHCEVFEDTEENKLEYMDIFGRYTDMVEGFIVKELEDKIENFTMEKLSEVLMDADEVRERRRSGREREREKKKRESESALLCSSTLTNPTRTRLGL